MLNASYNDFRMKLFEENKNKNKNINSKVESGFNLFDSVKVPIGILRESSLNGMSGKIPTYDPNLINSYFE